MVRRTMTEKERAEVDALLAEAEAENAVAREAYRPGPGEAERTAEFLRGWSRGRPITKATSGSDRFWRCGNRATMLEAKVVDEMARLGLCSRRGDTIMFK